MTTIIQQRCRVMLASLLALSTIANTAIAATMYSTETSFMGAGLFYGPGNIDDIEIFPVTIYNIGFSSQVNFVTPFKNNGAQSPNVCAEQALADTEKPDGLLSDKVTKINENANVCLFELNGLKIVGAIVGGGPHRGEQIAVTMKDGVMIMTMDFALDMGIGKEGIIRIPFYGTTGEVEIPISIQTQLGIEGGTDAAGSLKPGDKIQGRLGDYNNDGMLDGAIVVAGNIPLDSIFFPGAPYALIRYFETDIPYAGKRLGHLPVSKVSLNQPSN